MDVFPVFFRADDLSVTVFGGGEEARRKVRLLAKTSAAINVIAEEVDPAFLEEFSGQASFAGYSAAQSALSHAKFVIIAEADDDRREEAIDLARSINLPINVVDRPELCDFTVPSILDRGSVVAAVATGGAAPIIARDVRSKLEALLPKRIGELASFAQSFRDAVKSRFSEGEQRRAFWESVLRGPIAESVLAGRETEARSQMIKALETGEAQTGVVHIVGAGPGDPELLTLKALRALQDADIVFYDRLVGEGVLELIRRDADRVPVGKSKGNHSVPQEDIHRLLVEAAKQGRRVVRLKGGDSFVFGRGGEEVLAGRAAGVYVEVVPGVSSALAAPASAGVPVTHRGLSSSVTVVTGHEEPGARNGSVDWNGIAQVQGSIVIMMGVAHIDAIARALVVSGRSSDESVCVVERATCPNQRVIFGTLGTIGEVAQSSMIENPATIVIGVAVDALADRAEW